MPPPIVDEPDSPDTIEAFVTDLRGLYLQHHNRPTFNQLGRITHRSSSSLHAAVTYSDRLPSQATVSALVEVLAPDQISTWLQRRQRLDPRSQIRATSASEPTSTVDAGTDGVETNGSVGVATTGNGGLQPHNKPSILSAGASTRTIFTSVGVAVALIAGGLLAAPFDRGGISTVAFCSGNYPRSDGRSGQVADDGTWAGWSCELDDGKRVPIDMQLACRQQYPSTGLFGGAQYAVHNSQGFTSWRCYGSPIHG